MATGTIPLRIGSATLPDGSTGNAAPAIQRDKSSGANPKPFSLRAAFDATTDEMMMWTVRMPQDYDSGTAPVMKMPYKMQSATTGSVVMEGRVCAITPGAAESHDSRVFDTTNYVSDTVPGTVGHVKEISITLTNRDSLAPGDEVTFYLRRDADSTNATDDAALDMYVLDGCVEYTRI